MKGYAILDIVPLHNVETLIAILCVYGRPPSQLSEGYYRHVTHVIVFNRQINTNGTSTTSLEDSKVVRQSKSLAPISPGCFPSTSMTSIFTPRLGPNSKCAPVALQLEGMQILRQYDWQGKLPEEVTAALPELTDMYKATLVLAANLCRDVFVWQSHVLIAMAMIASSWFKDASENMDPQHLADYATRIFEDEDRSVMQQGHCH
eukprot:6212300-Amphidinium_carterae.1